MEPDESMPPATVWDPFEGWMPERLELIRTYERLLARANRKVNLISRGSADEIHLRHVIHSLSIAVRSFPTRSTVVDWGTGGGLPGIPLAIRFPNVSFHLVDSVYKKTWSVERFRSELGLENVTVYTMRAEDWVGPIDYAVSRATASLTDLWRWTRPHIPGARSGQESDWAPGLIALKGGDLSAEISDLEAFDGDVVVEQLAIDVVTGRDQLPDKYVVHVGRPSV